MAYDHNHKAGNRGDVIKHPALMASLGAALKEWESSEPFLFADTFAGYAHNPLRPGDGWEEGIGQLARCSQVRPRSEAPLLAEWFAWYVLARPSPRYGTYPGSSIIALDVATHLNRDLQVAAWDISTSALASLSSALGERGHLIRGCPAAVDDPTISRAQFLFIDPPSQGDWAAVSNFLVLDVPYVLVWMPLHPGNEENGESKRARDSRESALSLGYHATRVRWDSQTTVRQKLIGCQLFYRFPCGGMACADLKAAVKEVSTSAVTNWEVEDFCPPPVR